jgi:hypothetical protein
MKKHTDVIQGLIFIGLVMAVLFFVARVGDKNDARKAAAINQPSLLAAEELSFDFGTISMERGDVQHEFALKNPSAEPITITKLYTSCMCTKAVLIAGDRELGPFGMPGHGFLPSINAKIAPGEAATVRAIFDPAAHGPAGVGAVDRVVYVENSSGAPIELRFSAQVIP